MMNPHVVRIVQHAAALLADVAALLGAQVDAVVADPSDDDFGSAPERGGLYPSEDQDEDFGAPPIGAEAESGFATARTSAFDPDDLPLDAYEDCQEKERQEREPERRNLLRTSPLKTLTVLAFYAHALHVPADAEDAARSILCLPGSWQRRLAQIQEADGGQIHPMGAAAREYQSLWLECYRAIRDAHAAGTTDVVDHTAMLLKLGEPPSRVEANAALHADANGACTA